MKHFNNKKQTKYFIMTKMEKNYKNKNKKILNYK